MSAARRDAPSRNRPTTRKRRPEGISPRHRRGCRNVGSWSWRCGCPVSYQAQAWSPRDRKRISRTFTGHGALAAAKNWRQDASVGIRKGTVRVGASLTLREAADQWLDGARTGTIRNRSGDRYKPSTLRGYEQALTERLLPHFGPVRLGDLRLADVQSLADQLLSDGLDPSTIRNHLMPLRAIYRRQVSRGNVAVNPTTGLELPAVRGTRERFADPVEAGRLIAALPPRDRALWATAIYAGLRRGELMALEWRDVDLDANAIRVERSWDVREGRIPVKSVAGRRGVPIPAALRRHLLEHGLATGRKGFVFGRTPDRPFAAAVPARRAARI